MKSPSQTKHATGVMGIFFFFQAEDGIRDYKVTGVQTCALPISRNVRNEPDPKNRGGDYFSGSPSSFGGARNASLSKQAGKIDHSHGEEPAQHQRTREDTSEDKNEDSASWRKEKNDEKR